MNRLFVGQCRVRMSPGRTYATFHPSAPAGVSLCTVCKRFVIRGKGAWWAE